MELFRGLHAFIWRNPTANNCNTYFIDRGKRILIDPGHYALFEHVRIGLARLSLKPEDIDLVIITHCHPDHMEAAKIFAHTPTSIAVSAKEMEFLSQIPPHMAAAYGLAEFDPNILLKEGLLQVGEDVEFQVIPAPGHSPGSICLYWPEPKALISGDVAFSQGIGRTDIPGGDGQELKDSITTLSQLDVEYLLSGHGDFIAGREKVKSNFEHLKNVWFSYL